jgi:hypothetical protein
MGAMWTTVLLNLFSLSRDALGAYNEYTTGKVLRKNIGAVNILVPTLTKTLGTQHTSALVSSYALPTAVAMLGLIVLQGRDASEKLGRIYDTLDAQTALVSAKKFAPSVLEFLQQRIDETSNKAGGAIHWFFVYHPDTDWHHRFHALANIHRELKRLVGISHSLPHLCDFMMHIRNYLHETGIQERIVFHLLMPAYRRIYINEKLAFNPGLYPLVLEGHIYDSAPLVSLRVINEMKENAFRMKGINNLPINDPGSIWNLWNLFAPEAPVLDLGKDDTDDDYEDSDSGKHGSSTSQSSYFRCGEPSSRRNKGRMTPKAQQNTRFSDKRSFWVRPRPGPRYDSRA